jgi:hypothetical protein
VWILPFATFGVAVVPLPLPLFRPLFSLPTIRITIRERPHKNLSTPNVQHPAKVRDFMSTALQNVTVKTTAWRFQLRARLSDIGQLAQMHGEGSLTLHLHH